MSAVLFTAVAKGRLLLTVGIFYSNVMCCLRSLSLSLMQARIGQLE